MSFFLQGGVSDPWQTLYDMNWDEIFYHFQRSDTVFEDTARTNACEDADLIEGVEDLSGSGRHGTNGIGDNDTNFRWQGTAGRTYADTTALEEHRLNLNNSFDITDGTIYFLVDFSSTSTLPQRFIRQGSGTAAFQILSTSEVSLDTADYSSYNVSIPTMASQTLCVIITIETTGSDSTINLYMNGANSLDEHVTAAASSIEFTHLGNTAGGGSTAAFKSGCYAFGVSSDILTRSEIKSLMDARQAIVDVGVQSSGP